MTGAGFFVAAAVHRPDAIPSLKFFLQVDLINGQFRLRTASLNSVESGGYPNSSLTLRGTSGSFF